MIERNLNKESCGKCVSNNFFIERGRSRYAMEENVVDNQTSTCPVEEMELLMFSASPDCHELNGRGRMLLY